MYYCVMILYFQVFHRGDLVLPGTHFVLLGNDLVLHGTHFVLLGKDLVLPGTHFVLLCKDLGTHFVLLGKDLVLPGDHFVLLGNGSCITRYSTTVILYYQVLTW